MSNKLTSELLQERSDVSKEASELESRARKLRARQAQIDTIAEAELTKSGKSSIKRCGGWLLTWITGRSTVAWREEFIRVAGADEADRLAAAATPKPKLQITPPD
jgi:hypothetical protein